MNDLGRAVDTQAETIKELLLDGACAACLKQGVVAFPIDPHYHTYKNGHWPVLASEVTPPWERGPHPSIT